MMKPKAKTCGNSGKPDFKEEARMTREFVDQMIKRGEARDFLIKHGFFTKSGKLTKRYGGCFSESL